MITQSSQIYKIGYMIVFNRTGGKGTGELLFNGYRVSVWDDEEVLETMYLNNTGLYLKMVKKANCMCIMHKERIKRQDL